MLNRAHFGNQIGTVQDRGRWAPAGEHQFHRLRAFGEQIEQILFDKQAKCAGDIDLVGNDQVKGAGMQC
jgi:hypothetical protein